MARDRQDGKTEYNWERNEIDIDKILDEYRAEEAYSFGDEPEVHHQRRRHTVVEDPKPAKEKKVKEPKPPKEKKVKEPKPKKEKKVRERRPAVADEGPLPTVTTDNKLLAKFQRLIGADDAYLAAKKANKTPKSFWKKFLHFCLICFLIGVGYVAIVIAQAPSIDPSNINSLLNISSTLYDDQGKQVDNIFDEQKRTIIEYKDLPEDLIDAFVCLEDKTFWKHHGFNFIRIFGAIKDAVFTGHISGTSTITQQLARNVFLSDRMTERSINRKLTEAYYTVLIESKLSKEDIITAYLNTIYLGYGCYGVETAAESYFGCSVKKLTLEECAALAALPQAPDSYALVQVCDTAQVKKGDVVLKKGLTTSYVMNDLSKDRREICLKLMLDQEKITQAEYAKAIKVPLKKMLDIDEGKNQANGSSYFADYIIDQVINDLMEEKGYTYDAAYDLVYRKGLKIYTTMDRKAQSVVNKEFNNQDNFPGVTNIRTNSKGNVLDANGNESLIAYSNYFNSKGEFVFKDNEYKWLDDGSLKIFYGKRFNIYETVANGTTDYSLEFKNMYYREGLRFFTISGGYVTIPAQFKKVDDDFNLIIDAKFFDEYPDSFKTKNGLRLTASGYELNYSVVQPQGAMVIRDVHNGQIKAMIGGREINGELLYNRALATRQPGSSIKPLGVYSAALQKSFELAEAGKRYEYIDYNNCAQGTKLYGNYLTAASAVDDEPMRFEGRIWPQNSYSGYAGMYSMRTALQNSVNVCAVKIFLQVGADYSAQNIKNFGITSLVTDKNETNDLNAAALSLGGMVKGVSPFEMSNAYTAFANGGKVYESSCYTKVTTNDDEVLLEKASPKFKQAIDPGVAFIMRDMMYGVVTGGTGTAARISGVQVGGKTGTTTDEYDIWFDGFTPSYAAALWIGNDTNMQLTSMSGYAAALWGKIMRQIPRALKGSYPAKPKNVISVAVDRDTGYLPGKGSSSRSEYFTRGTEPTVADVYHGTVAVCTESGYLATEWCPNYKTISGFRRPYKVSSKVSGSHKSASEYYCNCHNKDVNKYPISPDVTLKKFKEPVQETEEEEVVIKKPAKKPAA